MAAIAGTPLARLPAGAACLIYSEKTLARARMDQQLSWYRTWIAPDAVSDETFVTVAPQKNGTYEEGRMFWIQEGSQFVLYGNADTNKAWETLIPEGPIEVRQGLLKIGAREFGGDDICGWFSYKRSRDKSVVVVADTGKRGLRLGYLVQPLFSDAEGLDYAFWDAGGAGGTARLIVSGKFPL